MDHVKIAAYETVIRLYGLSKLAVSNRSVKKIFGMNLNPKDEGNLLSRIVHHDTGLGGWSTPTNRQELYDAARMGSRAIRKDEARSLDPASFGSPLWRSAMTDIKNKNFRTLATGLSDATANQVIQHGPNRMSKRSPGYREPLRTDGPWQIENTRLNHSDLNERGMFAVHNSDGDPNLHRYARADSEASVVNNYQPSTPALLRYKLPASLVRASDGLEHFVPKSMFNRWARDIEKKDYGAYVPKSAPLPGSEWGPPLNPGPVDFTHRRPTG